MIDFIVYLLFMSIGMLVGSFFGWLLMKRLCQRPPGAEAKGLLGAFMTLIMVAFGASR